MTRKLFLDDDRNPGAAHDCEVIQYMSTKDADEALGSRRVDKSFKVVRTLEEFDDCLKQEGCPEFIAFDYHLTMGDTAMTAVKLLIQRDEKSNGKFIPENFDFSCHSSDPFGKKELEEELIDYLKKKEKDQ